MRFTPQPWRLVDTTTARPDYDVDYYGAFVLDPDGNNIEAVCRLPV